jgi:hypothetical protein
MKTVTILLVFAATIPVFGQIQSASDYGKSVTLQMLATDADSPAVREAKCGDLSALLLDPKKGNEDFSGISVEVLAKLRSDTICAVLAYNGNDIAKLMAAMAINTDASNELVRRLLVESANDKKEYADLLSKYKVLLAYELAHPPASGADHVAPISRDCSPAVESQIDGDFNGWNDEVIYKTTNGQIWQQANYHYHYHYAFQPEVTIYSTSRGCHMKVDDDDDEGVDVIRIK